MNAVATTPDNANLSPVKAAGRRIHRSLTLALQLVMLAGLGVSIYEQQWLNSAAISGILLLTALPMVILRRLEIYIPLEFELLTISFIFAALFLGETQGFYGRFWWWDLALHTTSGVLLGILGFLLVYVLNETPRLDMHMRPGFIAFFAFCFALTVGALWEVFEFTMDKLAGTNMQKPFLGDPSGLTDTMWDMIVDALGALAVALAGYLYMKRGMTSFIVPWIQRFIAGNPQLFKRGWGLGSRPPVDDANDAAFGRKSLCRGIRVQPERACAGGEGVFE
ncbi:MAG TPA: DUF2238 domain-containing protein [Verrucomicrobiae bacterium]|nr:DUF2238 domain-containing protein [Verrucomicrobiae bacterium]